jgi:hypothetical protein
MLAVLARYVRETIPDPLHSQGLWILTAQAKTTPPTWFRLTVSNTETLALRKSDGVVGLNISGSHNIQKSLISIQHLLTFTFRLAGHEPVKGIPGVWIEAADLATTLTLLRCDFVLDAAYELNIALIKQGSGVNNRYHRQDFADEVLAKAATLTDDGADDEDGTLVGPEELAALLGVEVSTIAKWKKLGHLPAPLWVMSGVPLWDSKDVRDALRHEAPHA